MIIFFMVKPLLLGLRYDLDDKFLLKLWPFRKYWKNENDLLYNRPF